MRLAVKTMFCLRKAAFILLTSYYAATVYAQPISSTFSYQGRLDVAGQPANGFFDFRARLRESLDGGTQVGDDVDINSVEVVEGIVNLSLDFGVDVFNGEQRFLELSVRDAAGGGGLVILEPRQPILPTPYSLSTTKVDGDIIQRGTIGSCLSNTTPASGSVTFSQAFSSPPLVFLTVDESADGLGCVTARVRARSTDSFDYESFGANSDGAVFFQCDCIHWLAIGQP